MYERYGNSLDVSLCTERFPLGVPSRLKGRTAAAADLPLCLEASYFAVVICCAPRLERKLAEAEGPDPTNM
jgi:hypothetical protein